MPAIRPSACPTVASYHDIGRLSPYESVTRLEAIPSSCAPTQGISEPFTTPPPSKKRRSPNAFILFRSHVIANKLYPSDLKHQNDISRFVADMWRSVSASERAVFFRKAEEEKIRYEIEGHVETQKKRTRKSQPAKRYEKVPQLDVPFNLPRAPASPPSLYASSPSPIEDNASPVPVLCIPTLAFYTSPGNASDSFLGAPQSMLLHSPSLLGWDLQANSNGPYPEERVLLTEGWLSPSYESSFSPVSSGASHNDVAAFDNAPQLELDLLLPSDMTMSMPMDAYPDYASSFFHMPTSKPYPFDAYGMPLAPL